METPREFPEMTLEERWEIWGQWIEQEQTKLRESTKDLEGFVMDNLPNTQKIMEGVQKRVDKALKDFEQFCLEVLQEALPPPRIEGGEEEVQAHAARNACVTQELELHLTRATALVAAAAADQAATLQAYGDEQACKLQRGGGGIG
jgi:hypothetical protein